MSKTVEEAQARLDAANAAYLGELRQNSERSEGSGAQERRREEHQQRLKDEVDRCERDLDLAKKAAPEQERGRTMTRRRCGRSAWNSATMARWCCTKRSSI